MSYVKAHEILLGLGDTCHLFCDPRDLLMLHRSRKPPSCADPRGARNLNLSGNLELLMTILSLHKLDGSSDEKDTFVNRFSEKLLDHCSNAIALYRPCRFEQKDLVIGIFFEQP